MEAAPKLEFVDLEQRPVQERDAAYRKTVRQNSMRAFRRKERLERVEKFQRAKAHAEGTATPARIQPSSAPVVLTQASQAHAPLGNEGWTLTDLASLDPYGMKFIGFDRSQHYLVNHFLTVMSPIPFRFNPRKEDSPIGTSWMHQVLQDHILLEATLFSASTHLDGIYKRQASPLTVTHRVNTIRTVNKMLETPEQTSDSVIGAIVWMSWSAARSVNYNGDI